MPPSHNAPTNIPVNIIILDDYQDAVRKLDCASMLEPYNAKVFTNTVKGIGQLSVRLRDAEVLVLIRERTHFPRQLLDKLRNQAKSSAANIAELERTVADLEASMLEKDAEIGTLKEQLASTNSSLATLIEMYRDKEQLAALQRAEMNQAFYAVGTAKELRENGVLTKEGGVIGVGGVNKLNTNDMNTSYFKEIDVTVTKEIPVGAKKARLVSSHPEGSYTLTGEKLVIDDVEKFWSVGRYLVIVAE